MFLIFVKLYKIKKNYKLILKIKLKNKKFDMIIKELIINKNNYKISFFIIYELLLDGGILKKKKN